MTSAVIQAGHVARTTGSTGTAGEQTYTLAVAKATVAELRRRGVDARWIDADEPSSAYRADYFVAVHADGSTASSAHGASVGYRNPRGKTFALELKVAYARRARAAGYDGLMFRADNYTVALGRYYGTGYALAANPNCRAVIVEGGFMTNPTERAFLRSAAGQKAMALAIADAIKTEPAPIPPEDDMALTDDDKAWLKTNIGPGADVVPVGTTKANPNAPVRSVLAYIHRNVVALRGELAGLTRALEAVRSGQPVDLAAVQAAAKAGAEQALAEGVDLNITVNDQEG